MLLKLLQDSYGASAGEAPGSEACVGCLCRRERENTVCPWQRPHRGVTCMEKATARRLVLRQPVRHCAWWYHEASNLRSASVDLAPSPHVGLPNAGVPPADSAKTMNLAHAVSGRRLMCPR
eukprot:364276-Chlamydomonas_euryale.AAC.6